MWSVVFLKGGNMKEELWWQNHANVCALARHLKNEGHWTGSGAVGNLIYFFEKPYNYFYEWGEYQKLLKGEKDAETTRFKKRSG